ncbi:MAG: FHA domain-containing serine/threonine-protein kinase [Christensenella sp.]
MAFEFEHTCPHCFKETTTNGVCSECGCNAELLLQKYPSALPFFTVLSQRYVVGGAIGAGGFGITYLCCDSVSGNKCAIKEFFPSDIATRQQGNKKMNVTQSKLEEKEYGMTRFYDEANVLSSVRDCRSIAHIYDVFKENDTAYMVMEYVNGGCLKDLQAKYNGHPPFVLAQEVFVDLCMTLSVIHSKSLLHRDISPDNILFDSNGVAKLIDFGAARFVMRERDKSLSVVLKKGYAPPEQYSSHGYQGPWTDIYALACTMYGFLSGQSVPDSMDRLSAGVNVIPLCELRNDVPKGFSNMIEKAMQLDYKKRYSSTLEMLEEAMKSKEFGTNKAIPKSQTGAGHNSFFKWFQSKGSFIQVVSGKNKGKRFECETNATVTIGTDAAEDINLQGYEMVSAQHCIITFENGSAGIRDVSATGTFFWNNTRLQRNMDYCISDKQKIYLGSKQCAIIVHIKPKSALK